MMTLQTKTWAGETGEAYTNRHLHTLEEWEQLYVDRFGITRTEMNQMFLEDLPKDMRILEAGCNVGNQLRVIQRMGFNNLYGIELQSYAVEKAKERTKNINIIQGNIFDIPFKDNYFDMVFTSGVLIHFPPIDLVKAMAEIVRCSKRYIWGYEYYDERFREIEWRGKFNLMWAADYARVYQEGFPLKLIREERFQYLKETCVDTMFLLEKE